MKTSIIICAFNEEKFVANVVRDCCKLNPESEVIVVDDGSTDRTAEILYDLSKTLSFRYERLDENLGKSFAMAHGIEKSINDIILFFDADISNIRKNHFIDLLNPILEGKADMVLGQPSETLLHKKINPFKSLTGERALLKRDIIPILDKLRDQRFGVETFLNHHYQAKGKRIQFVMLEGLKHPTKYMKTTPYRATKEYLEEGYEILLTQMGIANW